MDPTPTIEKRLSQLQSNSDLQSIIQTIVVGKNSTDLPSGTDPSTLSEVKLKHLVEEWRAKLLKQRMLIDLPMGNILLVGDIHGDFLQVQRAFSYFQAEEFDAIVFVGDIVDRGPEMIECLEYIIAMQILLPNKVFYLRGNHELKSVNSVYGFRGYCTGLYSSKMYNVFTKAFQQLPLAMKIGDFAFVTHGGVPQDTIYFHLMRLELKPAEPESGGYSELLWNDPDPSIDYFSPSIRGDLYKNFGQKAFDEFMEFHNLELFIRAHQAFPEGFRWMFDNRLLSLFSSEAGPYWNVDPHFAVLKQNQVELIRCKDLSLQY